MGRQTNGTTVLYSSSLALLQERFRQLQKIKEMRKEKELLRIFAEAEQASQRTHCKQAKCFFHPELIQPSRPLHDGSLSLQLDSYGDHSEIQVLETSLSIGGLWPNKGMHASQNSNETGVDTTLHL